MSRSQDESAITDHMLPDLRKQIGPAGACPRLETWARCLLFLMRAGPAAFADRHGYVVDKSGASREGQG
jgi:hypothetical protein